MSLPPLRYYQLEALEKARAAIKAGAQAVIIQMATGLGKTRTIVEACRLHVQLGGVPCFVAPRRELLGQATAALRAAHLEPGHDCFVRSIQELSMPGADIPPATMFVLDEARHYVADAWSRLRTARPDALYVGLDATPERGDGRGLGSMFDVLIEAISVKDAIAQGFLVPVEVKRPAHALGPGDLAQCPIDAIFAHAVDKSTVLFAASVELAKDYASRLYARGIPAAAVWGDMPTAERDNSIALFNEGRLHVLCNVHLLTEGWDAPRTEVVVLAGPVGTTGGYLQRVGRGMRLSPGKERCLVLDLRGVSHLHGEPDDERTWHLDGRAARRKEEIPDLRFCPVCGGVVLAGVACETCGHAGEMRKRKPRVLGLPIDRFPREHAMPDEQAAKALAGYLRVAQMRGYRRGWAERCFEHKYGRKVTPELMRLARSG